MDKRDINVEEKQYRVLPVELKQIDEEKATLDAVFSTGKEDRHGDVVLQDGWDLKNFKKNPVILNSHNYGDASEVIGKATGVKVVDGKLEGKITFAVNENPKAKVIFDLYAGGFLNAFSVGFIIKSFGDDGKGNTDYYTISEAELLEVSAVSVPANAYALAKQKGIDVESLGKVKSEGDTEDEDDEQDIDEDVEDKFEDKEKTVDPVEDPKEEDTAKKPEDEEDQQTREAVKRTSYSYISQVAKAIKKIETERREAWTKAASIINSLLNDDNDGVDRQAKELIKRRKVNQAVRELLKTK